MCTAIHFSGSPAFFTRTLDYETDFGESVIVTPRRFSFSAGLPRPLTLQHAIIGMGIVSDGIPLYFDAFNTAGLSGAALRFANSCVYAADRPAGGVASFALLPWVLGQCATVEAVLRCLDSLTVTDEAVSPSIPPAPLHWIFADAQRAVVLEATRRGTAVCTASAGVLTNDPPYAEQLAYADACADAIPGDWSSHARFVRAAALRRCAEPPACAAQALSLTAAVAVPRGCRRLPDGSCRFTRWTACHAPHEGVYYVRRFGESVVRAAILPPDSAADSPPFSPPTFIAG